MKYRDFPPRECTIDGITYERVDYHRCCRNCVAEDDIDLCGRFPTYCEIDMDIPMLDYRCICSWRKKEVSV